MLPEDAISPAPLSAKTAALLSVCSLLRDCRFDPHPNNLLALDTSLVLPTLTGPSSSKGSFLPGDLHHPLRAPLLPLAPHPPLTHHLEGCTLRHSRPHPLCHLFRDLHHHCHNLHHRHAPSCIGLRSATSAGLVPNLDSRHYTSPRPDCPPLLRPNVREGCCRVAMERLDPRSETARNAE